MKNIKTNLFALGLSASLISLSSIAIAKPNQEFDKSNLSSTYQFINYLNQTLKSNLSKEVILGINHLSTIKKNRQIVIQVVHNPHTSYSFLIDDIAQSNSRVNGVNFQNSFTLNILDSYCKTDLFYDIQAEGLEKEVLIHYEDNKGAPIATHKINRNLCS